MIFYILGTISALCFLLLVIKYPLRILKLNRANAVLMKVHEPASAAVFLIGIIQIIGSAINKASVSMAAKISGLLAYCADVIIIAACHMTKDVIRKMRDHRILSLIASVLTVLHIVLVLLCVSSGRKEE